MLWEPGHPGERQPLPPHRAVELIGYPPTERVRFDVEATVEGRHSTPVLAGLGLALEGPCIPPADPIELVRHWFKTAVEDGVSEPGVLSLATVNRAGRPSNRVVQTIRITDRGLVFASYSTSPKGRDIAETGWASGVLYWREARRQVILTGQAEQLSAAESDDLWWARSPQVHPMSVATAQSEGQLGTTTWRPSASVPRHATAQDAFA